MNITIDTSLLDKLRKVEKEIGNTPLYPIRNMSIKKGVKLFAKLEWTQLGGSVKSRPAFNIIKNAILDGDLDNGKTLLDATSGNTGIAYAAIGAALGVPVTLCLPENASEERKEILRKYGAEIIYTSPFGGTDEAQLHAKELMSEYPEKYFYADQYANNYNWKAHYKKTGNEVIDQTAGEVTHFVAGLGTTGTFVGTGRKLKEFNSDIELIGLQPESPLHGLEGWKHLDTAIVPKIYDHRLADRIIAVQTADAYDLIKKVANKEGLLISPSSAANFVGALKVSNEIEQGVIVTVFPDNGEKYGEVLSKIFS